MNYYKCWNCRDLQLVKNAPIATIVIIGIVMNNLNEQKEANKNNKNKTIQNNNFVSNANAYIFGKNAVVEAILSGDDIQKIFLCYGSVPQKILVLAKQNKINCVTFDKNKFRELEQKSCPKDAKTQGVIALKQIIKTVDLSDFLNNIDMKSNPILAILDGITDPQNLGAIARSAECAGVSALILPNKDSAQITPTAIKISAGALNYMNVIKVQNLILTIEKLKEFGFWLVGTDLKGNENYDSNIYDKPTVVVIGSEGKGISPSLAKHCDHLVKINMYGKINSLNASVAAGILFFEIQRQRNIAKTK